MQNLNRHRERKNHFVTGENANISTTDKIVKKETKKHNIQKKFKIKRITPKKENPKSKKPSLEAPNHFSNHEAANSYDSLLKMEEKPKSNRETLLCGYQGISKNLTLIFLKKKIAKKNFRL